MRILGNAGKRERKCRTGVGYTPSVRRGTRCWRDRHAFAAIARERIRAVVVLGDPVFVSHRKKIADLAVKRRLPAVGGTRDHVEAGGLMAYGPSYADMYRRTAYYVDRILKGMKPADLPIEQPTKFELVINLKTAKAIGLQIPPNVLARADRVIR